MHQFVGDWVECRNLSDLMWSFCWFVACLFVVVLVNSMWISCLSSKEADKMSKLGVWRSMEARFADWIPSLFLNLKFYQGSVNLHQIAGWLTQFHSAVLRGKLRFAPLPTINLVNPLALKSLTLLLCVPLRVQKQPFWSWTATLDPSPEVGVASWPMRLIHQPVVLTRKDAYGGGSHMTNYGW